MSLDLSSSELSFGLILILNAGDLFLGGLDSDRVRYDIAIVCEYTESSDIIEPRLSYPLLAMETVLCTDSYSVSFCASNSFVS